MRKRSPGKYCVADAAWAGLKDAVSQAALKAAKPGLKNHKAEGILKQPPCSSCAPAMSWAFCFLRGKDREMDETFVRNGSCMVLVSAAVAFKGVEK